MRKRRGSSRVTRIINITGEMHEIRAKMAPLQDRLAELEAELRRLVPEDDPAPEEPVADDHDDEDESSEPVPIPTAAAKPDETIGDKVLRYLAAHFGASRNAETISKAIGPVSMPTLRSTLQRLERDGKIKRVSRGLYAASQGRIGGAN